MKYILLIVSLIIISWSIKAQTTKGNIMLGVASNMNLPDNSSAIMNLGLSNSKRNAMETSSSSINLSPRLAYFVSNNFSVGLDLVFSLSNFEDDNFRNENSTILFGPSVKYYIPTSSVFPFIEINGSFGKMNSTIIVPASNQSFNSLSRLTSFGGGVGIAVFLGERVALDILAAYNSLTINNKEDNSVEVKGSLGLRIGFTILLMKH